MVKWIIKNKNIIYENNVFSLIKNICYHKLFKREHNFFTLNTRDWINIVALTDDNKFIMVKQHRLGTDEITIETPGGLTESAETPDDTASRELLEETGYSCKNIYLLKKLSVNPAILNNYIYFYFAPHCIKTAEQNLDEAEDIEIMLLTKNDIDTMIENGEINHSIIVTAFYLYFNSHLCDEKNEAL